MASAKVTKDFSKFNKKIRNLRKRSKTFEVGLFEPEQARKGSLLEYGEKSTVAGQRHNQVARPWFTNNMTKKSKDLIQLIEKEGQQYIEGDLSEDQLGDLLVTHCKLGVYDKSLKPLKEYTTLIKAGLLPRPDTGEFKQSRDAAEQIGIDSGDMIDSIEYKTRKK